MAPRRISICLVSLLGLALIAGAAAAVPAAAADAADRQVVRDCAAPSPDDHAPPPEGRSDAVTGWVDGYWYDEPVDVDASDGLDRAELDRLSARTAARFEALRCLRFEEVPHVEVIDRDELANRTERSFESVPARDRLFENAQFAALLLAGHDEDAVEVQQAGRTATVGGYYDFERGHIAIVSDDSGTLSIDEGVLAHEVGHALQDQQFNISRYERPTTDRNNGVLGLVEGDVQYIQQQYQRRCDSGSWQGSCVSESGSSGEAGETGAAGTEPPNWGLYFVQFQPYSDGPSFVEHVYERGGWAAVDELYDDPPVTARHVMDPESYGEFEPVLPDVEDRSGDEFERISVADGPDYDVVGQSGLSAIFMDTAYDNRSSAIVGPQEFLNLAGPGEVDESDPLEYDLEETDGWAGDRFYAYADGGNRTGSVWTLDWTDGEEARQFAAAYRELVEYRGGESVEDYGTTYAFAEDAAFDMAVAISLRDDRVQIVTAPTVDELPAVHTPVRDWSPAETASSTASDDEPREGNGDAAGPGFGVVATAVAVVAVALLARRR